MELTSDDNLVLHVIVNPKFGTTNLPDYAMGWLWNNNEEAQSSKSTALQSTPPPPPPPPPAAQPPSSTETPFTPDSTSNGPAPPPPTRDEQAFSDLKDLFTQIDPDRSTRASAAARNYASTKPEIDPDSLYSSSMSCTQCFDLAYYCSSMGGQLTNVYRYGGLRSCNEHWAEWRFCMRTKAMNEDTKKLKIREWNQMKAARVKVGRNSEDVWEVRREPVEGAFARSVDEFDY